MSDPGPRRRSSLGLLVPGALEQSTTDRVRHLPLTVITPNPYQVRTVFSEESIQELANSINENGLLEPIIVRPHFDGDMGQQENATYELIAGERRLRAYQKLKKSTIPAIVRPTKDEDMRLLALLENVQREDLSIMEKARAVGELKTKLGNVEAVAERLGWSRRTGFIYSRIGEADPFHQEVIQKYNFDLRRSEALLSTVDKFKKAGDKKSLDAFNEELKKGSMSVLDVMERLKPKNSNPDKNKTVVKGPAKHGFWQTSQDFGISLKVKKGKPLSKKDQETITHQANRFFEAIGAKKVDIKF